MKTSLTTLLIVACASVSFAQSTILGPGTVHSSGTNGYQVTTSSGKIDLSAPEGVHLNSLRTTVSGDGVKWTLDGSSFVYPILSSVNPAPGKGWGNNGGSLPNSTGDVTGIVTTGSGTLVAVQQYGPVLRSTDGGVTWVEQASEVPSEEGWNDLAYGDGVLVAVGYNSVMTSEDDGVTWTMQTSPASADWKGVTYGEGKFVMVNNYHGSYRVAVSSDGGETWTPNGGDGDHYWEGVTFGDGKFVAVGYNEDEVMVSDDGATWVSKPGLGNWTSWESVAYGDGSFVAVGSNCIMTSTDGGETWTSRDAPEKSNAWKYVAYGSGVFVAVATNGTNRIMASSDGGVTWTPFSAGTAELRAVGVTITGGFVTIPSDADAETPIIASPISVTDALGLGSVNNTSDEEKASSGPIAEALRLYARMVSNPLGKTWIKVPSPGDNYWAGVCYGGPSNDKKFVAVSYQSGGSNNVATSSDGFNWTAHTGVAGEWTDVVWGGDKFVAVGGGKVMTSPDGETWTERTPAEANGWQSVTYGAGKFVAVSYNGTNRSMYSADGVTWSSSGTISSRPYSSVKYAGGVFLATSYSTGQGGISRSTNGTSWTDVSGLDPDLSLDHLAYGRGMFVALTNYSFAGSGTDSIRSNTFGLYWSDVNSGLSQTRALTYADDKFLAVNTVDSREEVWQSTNGGSWTKWGDLNSSTEMYADAAAYGDGKVVIVGSANPPINNNRGVIWVSAGEKRNEVLHWSVKTASFDAEAGGKYLTNTTSTTFTGTLPGDPVEGDEIQFFDSSNTWDTNAFTINRNGNNIAGAASNLNCNVEGDLVRLVFDSANSNWIVLP